MLSDAHHVEPDMEAVSLTAYNRICTHAMNLETLLEKTRQQLEKALDEIARNHGTGC